MSKNNLMKSLLIAVTLLNCFINTVFADVAPDPISRTVSYLPIVLIIVVVVIAVLLIKKFFINYYRSYHVCYKAGNNCSHVYTGKTPKLYADNRYN